MRAGPLVAVLLLAACAGASPSVPATGTAEPARMLAQGLGIGFDNPFRVAVADNSADYELLWQQAQPPGPAPEVDFGREVVIYLGMAGSSSCPEVFQNLFIDHAALHVYGLWQPHVPGQACTDDLQSQGILLAVSRSVLPEQPFTLSLRAEPVCPDCADHPDQVVVQLR